MSFGKRKHPPAGATVAVAAPTSSPQSRAARPAAATAAAAAPAIAPAPAPVAEAIAGDDATGRAAAVVEIGMYLRRRLSEGEFGSVHAPTLLVCLGALAGYAAQQSIWVGLVRTGRVPVEDAFRTVTADNGDTYLFGDRLHALLASKDPESASLLRTIAAAAATAGADPGTLPDVEKITAHVSATIGTKAFGHPRLPAGRESNLVPWQALDLFWTPIQARLVKHALPPPLWPQVIADSAAEYIERLRYEIPPAESVAIVLEAAIPMSKLAPDTVQIGSPDL